MLQKLLLPFTTAVSERKFVLLAMFALALVLPLSQKAAAIFAGVLVLVTLIQVKRPTPRIKGGLWWMVALYALYAVGLLLRDNPLEGHHPAALEQKLSLIIFPVVGLIGPSLAVNERRFVLSGFVFGVLLFSVFSVGWAAIRYFETGNASEWVYRGTALGFHPTYISSYAGFAMALVLIPAWFEGDKAKWRWAVALWLLVFIVLLSSRAGILSATALLIVLFFVRSIQRRSLDFISLTAVAGVGLLLWLPFVVPGTSERVQEMRSGIERQADSEQLQASQATTSTQVRFLAWQCALELIAEHPVGVGTDDVTPELMYKYKERGEEFAFSKKLNAHNQYLETGVELGWPGLLALLAMLGAGLRAAFRLRDVRFQALLFVLGFNLLFESYFELQSGIVFALFFWMLFLTREPLPSKLQQG